jgi:hypothetical protein
MGLLQNLFKPSKPSGEVAASAAASREPKTQNGPAAANQPGRAENAMPDPPPAPHDNGSRSARGPAPRESVADAVPPDAVVLTLGDILDHIPTIFLRRGLHDAQRRFHLRIADVTNPDSPRPTVSLARIDAQCPGVIEGNAAELRATHVPLPSTLIARVQALHRASPPASESSSSQERDIVLHPQSQVPSASVLHKNSPAPPAASPPAIAPSLRAHEPVPEGNVELNLAAVMKRCPRDIVVRELPPLPEQTTLSVPLTSIAAQLPSGKVELTSLQFVGALPGELMDYFHPIDGVKVPLPLQEILEKLPPARREPGKYELATPDLAPAAAQPASSFEAAGHISPVSHASAPAVTPPAPPASLANASALPLLAPPPSAAARARMKVIPTSGKVAVSATKRSRTTKKSLKELAQRLASLPGVRGCAIIAHEENAVAGEFDRGMDLGAVRGLALQLDSVLRAGEAPVLAGVREILLPGDLSSFACFIGADSAVIGLLRTQTPLPIVRTEFATAVASLNSKKSAAL